MQPRRRALSRLAEEAAHRPAQAQAPVGAVVRRLLAREDRPAESGRAGGAAALHRLRQPAPQLDADSQAAAACVTARSIQEPSPPRTRASLEVSDFRRNFGSERGSAAP